MEKLENEEIKKISMDYQRYLEDPNNPELINQMASAVPLLLGEVERTHSILNQFDKIIKMREKRLEMRGAHDR